MLRAEDVSGAVSSEFTDALSIEMGCWPMETLFDRARSYREGYPRADVSIEIDEGAIVQESLIYDASPPGILHDFHYAIESCSTMSPFEYHSGKSSAEVSEAVEFIDEGELPDGVVGFKSVVTNMETGEKKTNECVFLRFDHEGKKGLIYLAVTNPSGEPADLSPMDLIDPALRNAEAALDHTGLDSSTPSPAPTTTAGTSEAPSAAGSPIQSSE
ncbi:hypothetical protein MANAM107_18280 [Actinomyces capricornis]|uniref:Uncharacterized protein n=1 Tax=Actinomyces capricornis TaxID=2755559 RepID=A0ABN6K5Q3_9ACTO|nr:hypothetical protein MANAM107_18280 [Actinomyces capricornis]